MSMTATHWQMKAMFLERCAARALADLQAGRLKEAAITLEIGIEYDPTKPLMEPRHAGAEALGEE